MINIRFADINDIPKIMEFIDRNWRKNHIMGKNRKLFEYQHLEDKEVRYVIGEDEEGKIYGTLGYILYNHSKNPDITSMMIKTIKNPRHILGWDLARFLEKETKCRFHVSPGINKRTAGIMVELGDDTLIKLKQYYRLNDLHKYEIAQINNKVIPKSYSLNNVKLVEIYEYYQFNNIITDDMLKTKIPYKDKIYLKHRYFDNPFYKYKFFSIQKKHLNMQSIIVAREVVYNNSKILRIIDFIGNDEDLQYIGAEIDRIIKENNYEYVDFYCYGINGLILKEAGFILRDENDTNIIPNYFEPFERRNVELYGNGGYISGLHMYKGDGDQDRPNII